MDFFKILKGGVGLGMSNFDRLFAEKHGGGAWHLTTLTGALPLSFKSKGTPLTNYKLYGTADGAGVETESGEPTGYKIPMTVESGEESTTTPIYIGDSKLGEEEYVDYESGKVYREADLTGLNEPLCGIGAYADSLDLSTGTLTRRIKKLALTGEEDWASNNGIFFFTNVNSSDFRNTVFGLLCSHLPVILRDDFNSQPSAFWGRAQRGDVCLRTSSTIMSLSNFKSYLAAQYAAGTPVTLWYVLKEPEVSTIPVPSGLTGAIEGYLVQDGTPTPETPIYPTANGIKQADGTYTIESVGLTPTDPPVALPELSTYKGENTLSCSEGLGEVSITGYIKGE